MPARSLIFYFCFLSVAPGPPSCSTIYQNAAPMPAGRYTAFLRDAAGTAYEARIFSPHEKVNADDRVGMEFRGKGEKYYSGSYQVALRRQGARQHLIERIPLFGSDASLDSNGVFTPWHQRVFVIKGYTGRSPDLLLITQYETSNTDYMRAFCIEQGRLASIAWRSRGHTAIGQSVTNDVDVKRLHGNLYQTTYFTFEDAAYGRHTVTWRFEPAARTMFLLRDKWR